ncbi:hypothetical protein D3P07_03955 [Paenibacillus sp. 1011MAR3C5]|uniref:hypothetical protein n=1 Tax=Paenibacillus sp. 1011MAR3C5 TaxID=1675787 RepID=UPI000E6BC653|nr:hypothetical protein [Paenibacillus sp. 1011MAR3C5]RJE91224.1 hypothetical protein D3P07_03955 [Paenibacillus sp. 1011MAR3C5]
MIEWNTNEALFGMVVIMGLFQIYLSIVLYRLERSLLWALTGLLIPFGCNVLLYQALKLDQTAGPRFERLIPRQRKLWRRIYLMLLLQYMALFAFVGWFLSPS